MLATPTNPLATIDDNNGIFFKSISSKLFGTDSAPNSITFEDKLNGNQVSDSTLPSAVTDSEVNIPVNIDSPYEPATITPIDTGRPNITFSSNNRVMKDQKNNAVTNYLNSHQSNFSVPDFIDVIKDQYSWGSRKTIGSNDGLSRCNWDGGSNNSGSYHTSTATYYWLNKYHPGTRRGFLSGVNRNILVDDYVWCGKNAGINVLENSMMLIRGYNANSNGYAGDSSENVWVNTNGFCAINGNIWCENKSDSRIELASGAALIVNGDVTSIKNIIVNSGAVLYINGNLTAKGDGDGNGINNYGGTIIVTGTINTTQNGIRNNNSGGTIYAGGGIVANDYTGWGNHKDGNIINVSGATMICAGTISADDQFTNSGTMRTNNASNPRKAIVNNGTLEASGNITSATNTDNNTNANMKCAGTITCTTLNNNSGTIKTNNISTTNGNVSNNPGNNSSGADAVIYANGYIYANGDINNNYDNNSTGKKAFIYVGGRLYTASGKTLHNYERSFVYGDGEIAPGSIDNKSNSQIVTDGSINTGNIDNSAGGWISAKTSLSAAAITNYAQIYSGGLLKATGAVSSKSSAAFRAAGDFDFSSTVTIDHSIFTCGGAVKGSGSITCISLIARDGITANSISFSGNVKTDGDVKLSSSLTVASTATLTIADGNLNVGAITNNNSIIVNGNITSSSGLVTNYKDIFCYGNMTVSGTFLNGTTSNRVAVLKCKGVLKVSGYLENYGNMYIGYVRSSTVPSTVVLNVTGVSSDNVDGNIRRRSIRNFGNILTGGSIKSNSVLYSFGGGI